MAGLLQDSRPETLTKVPFLGDIPILGWAFKSVVQNTVRTQLLILVSPEVVREPQALERLTVESREEFRQGALRSD